MFSGLWISGSISGSTEVRNEGLRAVFLFLFLLGIHALKNLKRDIAPFICSGFLVPFALEELGFIWSGGNLVPISSVSKQLEQCNKVACSSGLEGQSTTLKSGPEGM